MNLEHNVHISTVGVFYPERTMRALHNLHLSPGTTVVDVTGPSARWYFPVNEPTKATLTDGSLPITLRVIGIVRDSELDSICPHITILPLFERDAEVFHDILVEPLGTDWESEPDGVRPDVPLFVLDDNRRRTFLTDGTDLQFSDSRMRPSIAREMLKRNDIIVAYVHVILDAPLLSTPTYTFAIRHLTLVHSSTDHEAGLV